MKTIYLVIFFVLIFTNTMLGQNFYDIEGRLVDKATSEPIAFANIYNKSLKKGTISNSDGYFRLPVIKLTDTIRISYIGFKEQIIELKEDVSFYSIELEKNILILGQVTVTPKDNNYLFDIIKECRKSASNKEQMSKAYYELKSTIDEDQVELVEGYYNVQTKGYELKDLHLKAGRVALRPYRNSFFVSLESSKMLIMLNLFNGNDHFPKNPLELSPLKLKKSYYLSLNNKYLDNESDSIYVINYTPKDTSGIFFEGKIWVNKTTENVLKITLNCKSALIHPFSSLFPLDRISNVCLNITQSFKSINDRAIFNHIDFVYRIDYKSSVGKREERSYSIKTNAVLYGYDYSSTFFGPIFDFSDKAIGDYRKINGLPYNDFFWMYNDEYRLNDSLNTNELFFSDSSSFTNKTLFKSDVLFEKGLFEHPYVKWSENRINFHDIGRQSIVNISKFMPAQFNPAVKIYLDINTYNDSTNIVTSTIFDPYESYYWLPLDNQTHCFINIYFDLCEIERRKLEESLQSEKNDLVRVKEIYDDFLTSFMIKKSKYLMAVKQSTNKKEMLEYNNYVYKQLGINNFELFQLFKKKR